MQPGSKRDNVNAAEVTLAFHCAKRNDSHKSSGLTKKLSSDSETSSVQTKTAAAINGVIVRRADEVQELALG